MPWIITGIISSYLIGSIPTAYIFGRLLKGIDIRKFGSGNVGATNALRVLGKPAGAGVLVLDILKGFFAVVFWGDFLAAKISFIPEGMVRIILGFCCILGHNWTIFLNFKGGKGVAATLGILLGFALRIGGLNIALGLVVLTWGSTFLFTRVVSISSIAASVTFPLYMLLLKQPAYLILTGIIFSAFIIFRHLPNIKRLIQGKENRIHLRKPPQ